MDNGRADPFADMDLTDFTPKPALRPPVDRDVIRQVSEQNQFLSRVAAQPEPILEAKPLRRRGRPRTGRSVQFNMKVTQATSDRFIRLADAQGWVFGEMLERALDALERELEVKAGNAASR
jgi:hypothetical protein